MSDTRKPLSPHNEHPRLTPDRNVEAGVEGTFPASDPVSNTTTQGARAVSPGAMQGSPLPPDEGLITLSRRFPDQEAAKLTLETMVREGPIDRRMAQIAAEDGGAILQVRAVPADAARLGDLLEK